jgi:cysteine desulfurase family protein
VEIYLDNSATSFPKPECVYLAMDQYMRSNGASAGRGTYARARDAEELIYKTRKSIASLIEAPKPGNIVLTSNVTEALNMILKGYLKEGDTVLTSDIEHNAVWRPLHQLRKDRGIQIRTFHCGPKGEIDLDEIEALLDPAVTLVAMIHGSNVIGNILPVREITAIAHRNDIPVMLDAAQTAGTYPISIRDTGVDFLAFTGHKGLLGPMGTGGFYIRNGIALQTLKEGGTGTLSKSAFQPESVPDRYEAGTMNMGGIAGLHAALDFIQTKGIEGIHDHEYRLVETLMESLAALDGVEIYGPDCGQDRLGLLSFNINGTDPYDLASYMEERSGIMVRAGLHCAPCAHRVLGTLDRGCVRAGIGVFNSLQDIERTVETVKDFINRARGI